MRTVDRFIGEFQSDINNFIDKDSNRQLIVAPTGTGKTTAIIQYANNNPRKKIALLCPSRALVDNIKKDNPNLTCGYGAEFLSENKHSYFIVTTYDSIEKIPDVDLFVVDEGHVLSPHSSFREVVVSVIETKVKSVMITATPEVIEDLFPADNNEDSVLEFKINRPLEDVKIYSQKYNVKKTIIDIINNNKGNKNTVLIRVNSKKIIDEVIETLKPALKDRIAFIYSDEDNVLNEGQNIDKVNELKEGKILDIDFVLCTSIYDAGLSFEVDRDIDCYAVSQDNRCMPNPVNMVQLLARVRGGSGYKMSLTIIGNYGDYELKSQPIPDYDSKTQLCNELAHRFEQYTKISFDVYEGILRNYNISVTEIQKLGLKESRVRMASRMSDTEIAKNFNSFPKMYAKIKSNLEYKSEGKQIQLITGDEIITNAKNTPNVQRVNNILFSAVKKGIDFRLFIEESFSAKRFKAIEYLIDRYSRSEDRFSNLVRGLADTDDNIFHYKELGLYELNKSQSKVIQTLYNMMYKRCLFTRSKSIKIPINKELIEMINTII
jgi:hypothetical protein